MVTSSTVVLTTETDRRRVRQADGEKKRKREGDGEGEIERGSRKEQTECYRLHSPFITLAHTFKVFERICSSYRASVTRNLKKI